MKTLNKAFNNDVEVTFNSDFEFMAHALRYSMLKKDKAENLNEKREKMLFAKKRINRKVRRSADLPMRERGAYRKFMCA